MTAQCCTPAYLTFPSGKHPAHSRLCLRSPGKKLSEVPLQEPMTRVELWYRHPVWCSCRRACAWVNEHLDRDDDLDDPGLYDEVAM